MQPSHHTTLNLQQGLPRHVRTAHFEGLQRQSWVDSCLVSRFLAQKPVRPSTGLRCSGNTGPRFAWIKIVAKERLLRIRTSTQSERLDLYSIVAVFRIIAYKRARLSTNLSASPLNLLKFFDSPSTSSSSRLSLPPFITSFTSLHLSSHSFIHSLPHFIHRVLSWSLHPLCLSS